MWHLIRVRPIFIALAAALSVTVSSRAAHTDASLLLAADSATAGSTVLAGVRLKMEPEWHTYWVNAGASGIATTIKWDLPPGIEAGEIQWPVPKKLPPFDFVTYGYDDEVVLLVPLKLNQALAPGPKTLRAKVSWLECKESCIPGSEEVAANLVIGSEMVASSNAPLIASWQKKLPLAGESVSAKAWWQPPLQHDLRPLVIEWNELPPAGEADFYPSAYDTFELQGETERAESPAGKIRLRKIVKKFQGDWPSQISGVAVQGSGPDRVGYAITVAPMASGPSETTMASPGVDVESLGKMLLYAFIGGLILNIMPCVLPVIALKILGFVSESRSQPGHIRKLGLVYAAGVLASFLLLAGIIIGLKAAGHQAGWGIQFNSPYFLIVMTALVTLIALNLFGLFEVTLGGRAMDAAAGLAGRQGIAGAFFNGLLATLLATSCTAPFLGLALGFAFAQPPAIIVLVLLMVGVGLAAPYVLLSWNPGWLRFLPKPGSWMERFKIALGFPMLGAAVWLCSLLTTFYGERTWSFAIFLVFLGVSAWIFGEFIQRSSNRRGLAATALIVLLVAGYAYELEDQMRWRDPIEAGSSAMADAGADLHPSGSNWEPWSAAKVAEIRAQGRPVLVDFTARWCLNCQKNVKPVLSSQAVTSRLKELNAATLIGDYTRFPRDITDELNRFGRAGVPLVLVFPANLEEPPIVLPEALTSGIVVDALDRVRK